MEKKNIEKALLSKAKLKDDKMFINCKDAIKIAEDLGISKIEAGKICNGLKIKIENCQLGCF